MAANVARTLTGRDVDEAARPAVAHLAAAALPRMSGSGRQALFQLLGEIGTAEQASAVRALAGIETKDDTVRTAAAALAEVLEQRR